MSIDVSIRRDGIGEFLAMFPTRAARLSAEMCNVGAEVAKDRFSSAYYDGNFAANVDVVATDNGARVVAEGETVSYIEFGTGVFYGGNYLGRRPIGIVGIGEKGKHQGLNDSWSYYGTKGGRGLGREVVNNAGRVVTITHGNPPANAMAMAVVQMRDKLVETAREVFNND